MNKEDYSIKGQKLIELYSTMANDGYERVDNSVVTDAFSDFELRGYRKIIREVFKKFDLESILDYGCGGSNWHQQGFDLESGMSAKDYFELKNAYHFEPARMVDERCEVDCVVSFDVLEHIFVADIPNVLRDMFSHAKKLLVLNIACYPAAAKLPNGENAHITVRNPAWWKGMVDSISIEFPEISVWLITSIEWQKSDAFPIWNPKVDWHESKTFVIAN